MISQDTNNNMDSAWENKNIDLPDRESNPGLPRDRRGYWPLYYRGLLDQRPKINKYQTIQKSHKTVTTVNRAEFKNKWTRNVLKACVSPWSFISCAKAPEYFKVFWSILTFIFYFWSIGRLFLCGILPSPCKENAWQGSFCVLKTSFEICKTKLIILKAIFTIFRMNFFVFQNDFLDLC